MDRLIKRFDFRRVGILNITDRGVAYQRNMGARIEYDRNYLESCKRKNIEQPFTKSINDQRIMLVDKYMGRVPFTLGDPVLDIGCGSGLFVTSRKNTYGFDINPATAQLLKISQLYSDEFEKFYGFCMWDTLEHIGDPENFYFRRMPEQSMLFVSIPIIDDISRVPGWHHYRPNEHLYYFTEQGFVDWMQAQRFQLLETLNFETTAGRTDIKTFVFKKRADRYHYYLNQYKLLHGQAYGHSAHLYFDMISKMVLELDPGSILDYGCGRSDLVAHFWKDGTRRIAKYDPGISDYKAMPEGVFDLVIACDVLEHIPLEHVDIILGEIRAKSERAIFTISMRPSRAKLPDGSNAHVTLLTATEWAEWIKSVFGSAIIHKTQWEHINLVTTFG